MPLLTYRKDALRKLLAKHQTDIDRLHDCAVRADAEAWTFDRDSECYKSVVGDAKPAPRFRERNTSTVSKTIAVKLDADEQQILAEVDKRPEGLGDSLKSM